jgi:hypothetical protein
MSFDLVKQDFSKAAEGGYTFELMLPTGAPSGAKLTIIGDMSATVKVYERKRFSDYQRKETIARRKGKDLEDISLDEAEEFSIENALVRLVGWEGITSEGKDVVFTKEKAKEVLTTHSWIRDAIVQEARDVNNFCPK